MSEIHLQKCLNIFPNSQIYVVRSYAKLNLAKLNTSKINLIKDLDGFIELLDNSN